MKASFSIKFWNNLELKKLGQQKQGKNWNSKQTLKKRGISKIF